MGYQAIHRRLFTNRRYFLILAIWIVSTTPFVLSSKNQPVTDGPYVFELNHQRIVCSLVNGDVITRRYPASRRIQVDVPAVTGLTITLDSFRPRPQRRFQYRTREKIFALSDVHGQFNRLREILTGNHIMNRSFAWTFGKGHLVLVGDIFDRGPMVTECLWLLVHLQGQAARAGGRVHVLLGNHDQMVMRNDLRYIHDRYREICRLMHKIPYPDLFGPDTFLGRWLRACPAVIRINDTLFVHAGIHPRLAEMEMSMRRINRVVRKHMDSSSVVHVFNPVVNAVFGRNGVFWSRGYFQIEDYDPVSREGLAGVLAFYNASRIVVGHTRFDHVAPHMDGRVLGTAVNTEEDLPAEGLMIINNRFFRADHKGELTPLTGIVSP